MTRSYQKYVLLFIIVLLSVCILRVNEVAANEQSYLSTLPFHNPISHDKGYEDFKGKKTVVVFGRITCGNTMYYVPTINDIIEETGLSERINVLFYDTDQPVSAVTAYINAKAWEHVYTFSGGAQQAREGLASQNLTAGSAYPTVFYLNEAGDITHTARGFQEKSKIQSHIRKMFDGEMLNMTQQTYIETDEVNITPQQITPLGFQVPTDDGAMIYIPTSLYKGKKYIDIQWKTNVIDTHELSVYLGHYLAEPITVVLPADYGNILLVEDEQLLPIQQYVQDGKRILKLRTGEAKLLRIDAPTTFSDIANVGDKQYIEELAKWSLVQGDNGQFKPTQSLTRKQVSLMLSRGLVGSGTDTLTFPDLKDNEALKHINGLHEKGIWKATDFKNGKFELGKMVTRQEAIVLLYRALQANDIVLEKATPTFSDASLLTTAEAKEAAGALQQAGIFVGSNGKLKPQDKLTRAQFAKVLYLAITLER